MDITKLTGFTPGLAYAAPIRGAMLGFPENLKFVVANRDVWMGAAASQQDAELWSASGQLLALARMGLELAEAVAKAEKSGPCIPSLNNWGPITDKARALRERANR